MHASSARQSHSLSPFAHGFTRAFARAHVSFLVTRMSFALGIMYYRLLDGFHVLQQRDPSCVLCSGGEAIHMHQRDTTRVTCGNHVYCAKMTH